MSHKLNTTQFTMIVTAKTSFTINLFQNIQKSKLKSVFASLQCWAVCYCKMYMHIPQAVKPNSSGYLIFSFSLSNFLALSLSLSLSSPSVSLQRRAKMEDFTTSSELKGYITINCSRYGFSHVSRRITST